MNVAVVGAGIVGLATARALVRAGHRVTVLEQAAVPNPAGSSYGHHRLIRHPYGAELGYTRMVDEAYAAWDRLWADLGCRLYAETGTLVVGRRRDAWADASAETLARAGHPVTWLDADALRRRFPLVAPDDVGVAFWLPSGGALLASSIVAALADWLRRHGARLHAGTRVRAVDAEAGRLVLDDGAALQADAVVVAAGPWIAELVPHLAERAVPSRQVVVYAAPPRALRKPWRTAPLIIDIDPEEGFYLVPPVAGTPLKIGDHRFSLRGHPDADRVPTPREAEAVYRLAASRLTDFDAYRRTGARTCFYTVAPEERFVLERRGRAWIAAGFSGHGFKFGAVVGERVADAVSGARTTAAVARWMAGHET